MKRRRLLQTAIFLAGLVGIALVVARTVEETDEQVMPSPAALVVAGILALVAITSSARAWATLFSDLLDSPEKRLVLRGTFYLSQLTKYLPVGGVVQTASQVGLATSAGVTLRRAAVAFPVTVVGAVTGGATLASGLVFSDTLPTWVRALSLLGLAAPVLLHRGLMARVLNLAHRFVRRVPTAEDLPTQRSILAFYGWALITIGSLCVANTVLLGSVTQDVRPIVAFSAFAASWVVGFLVVPLPAGVGVREAMLVALLPGVGTAPLLAASLALRLLSIAAELLALGGNKLALRRRVRSAPPPPRVETATAP
jgi:uncharacterized membrane protein YbhN (UPF0104 family)